MILLIIALNRLLLGINLWWFAITWSVTIFSEALVLGDANRCYHAEAENELEAQLDYLDRRTCVKHVLVVKQVNGSLASVHQEAASLNGDEAG